MQLVKTTILTPEQFKQVDELWNTEYPKNLEGRFGQLLDGSKRWQHCLILDEKSKIMAWALDFERDDATWFAIIVNSNHQRKGYGKILLNNLKADFDILNGWLIDHNKDKKEDGSYYQSPIQFYKKNGFEILSDQRIEADIISAVKIRWKRTG